MHSSLIVRGEVERIFNATFTAILADGYTRLTGTATPCILPPTSLPHQAPAAYSTGAREHEYTFPQAIVYNLAFITSKLSVNS